ncbi:hypothetical protein TrLO_g8172 [Triparma laevis f. longispina]|uniref:PI3K/PI4K catalytic domain-containing protein n=1 Tax=Triparma laevis f. longispina TaxID=1714387 RepID=A0A9W7DTS6_9STRA|nr:hypothetical protein TrLO_g8172 [Triparma laevis f. longispina]
MSLKPLNSCLLPQPLPPQPPAHRLLSLLQKIHDSLHPPSPPKKILLPDGGIVYQLYNPHPSFLLNFPLLHTSLSQIYPSILSLLPPPPTLTNSMIKQNSISELFPISLTLYFAFLLKNPLYLKSTYTSQILPNTSNILISLKPHHKTLKQILQNSTLSKFIEPDSHVTLIKTLAFTTVTSYILGLGDRHNENILLSSNGEVCNCDYEFCWGRDPKFYLPVRVFGEFYHYLRRSNLWNSFLESCGALFIDLRRKEDMIMGFIGLGGNWLNARVVKSENYFGEKEVRELRLRLFLDLNENLARSKIIKIVREAGEEGGSGFIVDTLHEIGGVFK